MRQAGYFLMLFSVALLTGCATSAVISQATESQPVDDQIAPIQWAYRTPAGGLLLCTSGTLASSHSARPFSLRIPVKQLQRPLTNCSYRGHVIELSRSSSVPGWPDAVAIQREQLTAIPVGAADRGLAVESAADVFRNQLRVIEGATDTIYNITGYGTGHGLEFVYVRRDAEQRIAFTLQPAMVHPHLATLLYLPIGVVFDGLIAGGTILGQGVPPGPSFWDDHPFGEPDL